MFDEFVEHAGTPGKIARITHINEQGFEPDGIALDPDSFVTSLETGYQSGPIAAIEEQVFKLGRVQLPIPGPLVAFVVASDMLYMAVANDLLIHINLKDTEKIIQIPLKLSVYKLFLDPSGRHLIITSQTGDNYYLYSKWKEFVPKPLKSFKMIIESVAWNSTFLLSPAGESSTSTREILLGGRNGVITEALLESKEEIFKNHDRYVNNLFTLPQRQPITGLNFQWFPAPDNKRGLVIASTTTRIYQFIGSPPDRRYEEGVRMFTSLFAPYKEAEPKFLELLGSDHSELHSTIPSNKTQSRSVAWLTGQGIYHGSINFGTSSPNDGLIESAQLLPYPQSDTAPSSPRSTSIATLEIPISIAITNFHFLMLFKDRISSVCSLDMRLDFEEEIPLEKRNERVLGLCSDPVSHTYWIYTDASLFELQVQNEARDIWQVYMERGEFDTALKFVSTTSQRETVTGAQGDAFFAEGLYAKAAERYAQSSRSFEEVTLRLVDSGDRDALQYYLFARLSRTKKADLTQRMMLATWLVEFYLSKYNDLDDLIASESASHDVEDLKEERNMLDKDLRQFFETYQANLDRQTTYDLILSHGRTEVFLHYASVVGDYEKVLDHWILEEEWERAIDVLNRQSDLNLYYRHAPVLLRNASTIAVDSWIRQQALDPVQLIPALLQLQHQPRDPLLPNQAIRYLNHVIFEQNNTSPTIHNLLITFYASQSFGEDERPLLRFLSTVPKDMITSKPYYDLDYALRICKQNGRIQPCVHLYAEMGLWENSVDLALSKGDLELAKENADKAEDDERLRKKLWLKIARFVVQDKKDIKSAMAFIKETTLLKIEDILPFFPDFVVIDDFKDEICLALEEYTKDIERLKTDMDEATKNAEAIKKDISGLKKRFVTLETGERCSFCSYPLFSRQFYVFPCQHTFHADCLIGMVKEYLPAHVLRKILLLQDQLVRSTNAANTAPLATPKAPATPAQRALLSSQFPNQQNGRPTSIAAGLLSNPLAPLAPLAPAALGRNMFAAADRVRDLIVPDALANAIALPSLPWTGGAAKKRSNMTDAEEKEGERAREDLDELLASSCPLCESVVAGLDKPFVERDEDDSWQL